MPTYEYRCLSCGYYFEKFQSIHDEPVKTCPKCGGKVQKLISSGAGLIFKGSGFYITDYKKNNSSYSNGGNGKKDSSSSSTEKSEKKESKPAESANKAESKT